MPVDWAPTLAQSSNSFTSQGSYSDADGSPPHWTVTWDNLVAQDG